ncbi:Cys-every-fifth RiPP peptide CefA [Arthrobacter sp. P2b]|uniref:Cys-every-fifth RiPP peptide CefA n=1 Tax=Arthrobacter sp. P2b TaxID=1938741 RepID=UPI0034C5D48E
MDYADLLRFWTCIRVGKCFPGVGPIPEHLVRQQGGSSQEAAGGDGRDHGSGPGGNVPGQGREGNRCHRAERAPERCTARSRRLVLSGGCQGCFRIPLHGAALVSPGAFLGCGAGGDGLTQLGKDGFAFPGGGNLEPVCCTVLQATDHHPRGAVLSSLDGTHLVTVGIDGPDEEACRCGIRRCRVDRCGIDGCRVRGCGVDRRGIGGCRVHWSRIHGCGIDGCLVHRSRIHWCGVRVGRSGIHRCGVGSWIRTRRRVNDHHNLAIARNDIHAVVGTVVGSAVGPFVDLVLGHVLGPVVGSAVDAVFDFVHVVIHVYGILILHPVPFTVVEPVAEDQGFDVV